MFDLGLIEWFSKGEIKEGTKQQLKYSFSIIH